MRLGIVAQRGNDRAAALAAELHDEFADGTVTVVVDEATGRAVDRPAVTVAEMADCALVVSIGGDGTFLYAARHAGATPVMGVNLGEVGFLNGTAPGEATKRVREEVDRIRETGAPRFCETARVRAEGDGWSLTPGLNEVTVRGPQRGHGHGVDVNVEIDGAAYASGHADGVLVATPTGSTAYNLSEGGPIVHPAVDGLIVNGMAATAPMPPLLVPPTAEIVVRASGVDEVAVASDGTERQWVETPASITVRTADEPARIAGPRSDFFRALDKLA